MTTAMSALPAPFPIFSVTSVCDRNEAFAKAFSDENGALLLLDSRISLCDNDLSAMIHALRERPNSLLGCRSVDIDIPRKIQLPGWRWSASDCEWRPEWCVEIKTDLSIPNLLPCDWLSPEVMLIPRAAWETIGPFDSTLTAPLSVVDWCLRARKAGIFCYEVQSAVVLIRHGNFSKQGHWGAALLSDLPSMLTLAHKHHLPSGRVRLVLHLINKTVMGELRRVRYWTEYDHHITLPKRTFWYLRNIQSALLQARVPSLLRIVLKNIVETLKPRSYK